MLGPERLPKAARFAGLWVRKARAQWHSVRSELEQRTGREELQRSLRESQQALREAEARLREATAEVQADAPRALDPPATSDGERRDG